MVTRDAVITAAEDFLKAVAEVAKERFSSSPQRLQRSMWMVKTGASTMSGQEFEHATFDLGCISTMYQLELMRRTHLINSQEVVSS
jgi:hypothetical protein